MATQYEIAYQRDNEKIAQLKQRCELHEAKRNELAEAVRQAKAAKSDFKGLVSELTAVKTELAAMQQEYKDLVSGRPPILVKNREGLDGVCTRRFIYVPAYEIYGGVAGLFDYGPPGAAIKANLLAFWRQHFVVEEGMLELEGPALTPEAVLKTSGHVAKFRDVMVKDSVTGESIRADHLVEEHLEKLLGDMTRSEAERNDLEIQKAKAGGMNKDELADVITKFEIKSAAGNPVSVPFDFNLMFATQIGPDSNLQGYLRPELAQGIFVNFDRLLKFNNEKMPFAGAQIGSAYRNEIAPRNGLIRVREFTLAEIEHFCNPHDKSHPKFASVAHVSVQLFTGTAQVENLPVWRMTIGRAVQDGIVKNETLGYFLARTQLFLEAVGVRHEWIRFRQHKSDEMAHYASDCWDAEILSSFGWIECVGHADRACFDLDCHAKATKREMKATITLDKPIDVTTLVRSCNKKEMRSLGNVKLVSDYLEKTIDDVEATRLHTELVTKGSTAITVGEATLVLTRGMFSVTSQTKKVFVDTFTPNVVEPSFGIGRILACLLEHSYYQRTASVDDAEDDAARTVLRLPAVVAPYKCSVLTIQQDPRFTPVIHHISSKLSSLGVSYRADNSGASLGRRYARADEIGIPFGITLDFLTIADGLDKAGTVTIRERDTMEQVMGPIDTVCEFIARLADGRAQWSDAIKQFASVTRKEDRQVPAS
eukprot:TRINITY_DN4347_c0_g1_i1.p1 TRINITY_DN4347_c0_g1~~TRINITY_DN4347_c0_g1_i1.p1  ORF type:complete len:708 (+),score=135.81 TRINITY_DN4347_c0_g1_i1:52-2175(+)